MTHVTFSEGCKLGKGFFRCYHNSLTVNLLVCNGQSSDDNIWCNNVIRAKCGCQYFILANYLFKIGQMLVLVKF